MGKIASKKRRIRPYFDEYRINGKKIILAGEGRLVNLACAEGHPSTVMALSFCGQALAVEYGVKHRGKMPNKVISLPPEIDDEIAKLQLDTLGIRKDEMTKEQKKYSTEWREGT